LKAQIFCGDKTEDSGSSGFSKKIQKSQNAEEKFWLTNKSFEKYL